MKYNKSYLARRLALSLIIGGMFVSSAYALPQGGAVVGGGHAGLAQALGLEAALQQPGEGRRLVAPLGRLVLDGRRRAEGGEAEQGGQGEAGKAGSGHRQAVG